MKYLIFTICAFVLASCIKDKFEGSTEVFVGTWTWNYSIEYALDPQSQEEVQTIIPASDYPSTYAVHFFEKGKVKTIKDNIDQEQWRVILDKFKFDQCQSMVGGNAYRIKLNNSDTDTIAGCIKIDTLIMSDFHLPLQKGESDYPYYKHVYLK